MGHHVYPRDMQVVSNFSNKKYLTIINSNHRVDYLKRAFVNFMYMIGRPFPGLQNKEMYLERLNAIQYFSQNSELDLYGNWWDKPVRYTNGEYEEAIKKTSRTMILDKHETLKQYKFSLVIENVLWEGLVTEKMIDCLFAGCVPVYWGAPDVTDYVPADCFIDFRKFKNFAELDEYLRAMDEKTYNQYIENINRFIKSEYSYNLSAEKYMKDLIDVFELYF